MTFDDHRVECAQCAKGPYGLCDAGATLLIAEVNEQKQVDYIRPMSTKQIAAMVARKLREKCPVKSCGAPLIRQPPPSWDLNIVCSVGGEAHYHLPIDTGPFSLGRRVD